MRGHGGQRERWPLSDKVMCDARMQEEEESQGPGEPAAAAASPEAHPGTEDDADTEQSFR